MLSKLLKYELRYFYKYLSILYLVVFGLALVIRLIGRLNESINLGPLSTTIDGVFVGCIIGVLVNNISRVWLRFRNNIFGDEGYLTNTLPVSKNQIYFSKCAAAMITLLSSILIGIIAFLMAYYNGKNSCSLWLQELIPNLASSPQTGSIVLACFLELLCLVEIGYLGIVLGYRASKAKKFRSIIYSLLIFLLLQLVTVLIVLLASCFEPNLRLFFSSDQQPNMETLRMFMVIGIFNYLIYIIALHFVSVKILDRGINLD